ncbi:MAG TPA: M67 family metallopeptidase [Pyrinomonadaceae bacterium]|jgi:proteasome lid subunit RPN8/RPN11|nr:M67 family metallopeptidase [Pyrinomonadaceae bacterium]
MPLLELRSEHLTTIIAHACETSPAECCGLIGGVGTQSKTVYRLRNVTADPELAYEAAPQELFAAQRQMRERGEGLLAIYHSHPRSNDPSPSETDVRLAYYPSATYLIVGLGAEKPVVKAFKISEREQCWQQVEYVITD